MMECCEIGYKLGFRTFVLQGGEDGWFSQEILEDIISTIKKKYPDCAITLSIGERSYKSYLGLFHGAINIYLLLLEIILSNFYKNALQ